MHASSAAYTNTTILRRAALTPNASTMSSPPLSARIARPGRESRRLCVDHSAASTSSQIRTEVAPLVLELESRDGERGNAGHARVPAENLEIAEDVVEADAPRDGRERKVVSLHPQRDESEEQRDDQRDRKADGEREPRGRSEMRREVGGRVRAEADERGLPERRLPGDAGQEHEPERDHAVEADVVAERDVELRRSERHGCEHQHEEDQCGALHYSSSS